MPLAVAIQRDPVSLRESVADMADSVACTFDQMAATYRKMASDAWSADDKIRLLQQAARIDMKATRERRTATHLRRFG
jgi:hypothetical protein